MKKVLGWLLAAVVVVGVVSNAVADPEESSTVAVEPVADPAPEVTADPEPTATPTPEAAPELLFVTDQKDGDSWDASDGAEYRLGQVNAPELSEPCGPEAAEFTRGFLADGFTVDAYSGDRYDRVVAEVFDPAGTSLNIALAESGLGNDTYLEQFRAENPDLASRLDAAFATAAPPACGDAAAAEPVPFAAAPAPAADPGTGCMAEYSPCVPAGPDLDCPDINGPVTVTGGDPFRLDRDGDGIGCD